MIVTYWTSDETSWKMSKQTFIMQYSNNIPTFDNDLFA